MISDIVKDYIDYKLRKDDILYRFIIVIVIKKIDIFKIIFLKIINFLCLMLVLIKCVYSHSVYIIIVVLVHIIYIYIYIYNSFNLNRIILL